MRSFLFLSTLILHLSLAVSCLSITLSPTVLVNTPTTVFWTRQPSDPAEFDFRFVINERDVGLAKANMRVSSALGGIGTAVVTFPRSGLYVLKAVSGPENTLIGTSNEVRAYPPPTITLQIPSSTSSMPSGTPTTSTTETVSMPSSKSRVPIIVGIIIGTLVLVGLVAVVIVYLLRRRNKDDTVDRLSFHQDQMVQRRSRFLASLGRPRSTVTEQPSDIEASVVPDPAPTHAAPPESDDSHYSTSTGEVDIERNAGLVAGNRVTWADRPNPFSDPVTAPTSHEPVAPNPTLAPSTPAIRPLPTLPPFPEAAVPLPTTPMSARPPFSARYPITPLPPIPILPPISAVPPFTPSKQRGLPPVPRTHRQEEMERRIEEVKGQLEEVEVGAAQHVVEGLRRQLRWLRENLHSDWALGLTDLTPPGFQRYMMP